MSTEEKNTLESNEKMQEQMTPEQIKDDVIAKLTEKAKSKKNLLTYADIAEFLDGIDLDKHIVDDIYESLLSKDIEIGSETGDDFAAILDTEDVDGKDIEDDGIVVNEAGEIDIEATLPKGVAVDDPVRMYLKEIGKVSLLSASEEIELAKRMEQGDEEAKKRLANAVIGIVIMIALLIILWLFTKYAPEIVAWIQTL